MLRYAVSALLFVFAGSVWAQQDPDKAAHEFERFEHSLRAKAEKAGKSLTNSPYREELIQRAKEAVDSIDLEKLTPKQVATWAGVLAKATRHRDAIKFYGQVLTSDLSAVRKEMAQRGQWDSLLALRDGKGLVNALETSKPTDWPSATALSKDVVTDYADFLAKEVGVDRTAKMLDLLATRYPETDHKAFAKRTLEATKKIREKNPPAYEPEPDAVLLARYEKHSINRQDSYRFNFIVKKALLLADAGRLAEADKVLDTFAAPLNSHDVPALRATAIRSNLALIGTKAPQIEGEKKYGGFNGLNALKGKVVVLGFQGPLSSSAWKGFSNINRIYGDLHATGLEFVAVSSLRKFYDDRWDLEQHKRLVEKAKLPWASVFMSDEEAKTIPSSLNGNVVVLDRKGNIRFFIDQLTMDNPQVFREKLEGLLSEK